LSGVCYLPNANNKISIPLIYEVQDKSPPLAYKLTEAQQIPKTPTHKLIKLPTHQLTNPSTQKLKIIAFILQTLSIFRSVLAKIWVKK